MFRNARLPWFLIVTFAWSWSIWGVVLYLLRTTESTGALLPWILLGAWGPTVGAITITAISGDRGALRLLLSGYLRWRVGARWYVMAIVLPPVFVGAGLLLDGMSGADLGGFTASTLPLAPVYLVMAIPTGALAEELGWRGYLLPKLEERHGALTASVAVGLVWFAWHVPLFWAPSGTTVSGAPVTITAVLGYAAFVFSVSFIFTWLSDNTRGSVLMAVLLHASLNAGIPFLFFPDLVLVENDVLSDVARRATYWAALPIGLTAVAIVVVYGRSRFSRRSDDAQPGTDERGR